MARQKRQKTDKKGRKKKKEKKKKMMKKEEEEEKKKKRGWDLHLENGHGVESTEIISTLKSFEVHDNWRKCSSVNRYCIFK